MWTRTYKSSYRRSRRSLSNFDLLGLQRGRFVVRVRWAPELIDTSLTLRDLGCAHSLTIATPLSGRSPPFTRAAGGGHP